MTVAALWSILDGGGCGTAIGLQDWLPTAAITTCRPSRPQRLAIDLSIWICEAQTSTVRNFHADPAVFLTYQRAVTLLKMGLQLVAVLEGDRRRSGRRGNAGAFAAASENCERMLSLLGVPVVRATHEGEALCALLNRRDVVDGVLSNDGDCLLFGATTVFTDFSLENLQRGAVKRFDATNLQAALAPEEGADDGGAARAAPATSRIALDRDDLIAFALLCGSDIVGNGVPTMGAKKAIKFIDMCRRSDASTRTALEVLQLWDAEARLHAAVKTTAAATVVSATDTDANSGVATATAASAATKQRCCSLCLHAGDKRTHEKSGCAECGSSEGCFPVSVAERYKSFVKDKALTMQPTFASQPTLEAYRNPNGNAIPRTTTGTTLGVSAELPMQKPRYQEALRSSLLFKGNSPSTSEEYLRQTMPKLLARLYILDKAKSTLPENRYASSISSNISEDMPAPRKIIGRQTKDGRPVYLIEWVIGRKKEEALIFVTSEWQSIVDAKLSALVDIFRRAEQKSRNEDSRLAMFGQGKGRGSRGGAGGGRLGGEGGVRGGNNRAGAKRHAQNLGRKGARGKRERNFSASLAVARARGNDLPRHNHEADKPLTAGDDTTNLAKFIMRKNHVGGGEEIDADDENVGSDCSDLSFDGFDDIGDDGDDRGKGVGNKSTNIEKSENASGHGRAYAYKQLNHVDGGAYKTPNQYHQGNLANPHAGFKPFESKEKEDGDGLELEPKLREPVASEDDVTGAHAAAADAFRPLVLETPNVYYYGQLANPRELPPKEPETNDDDTSSLQRDPDVEVRFKTPMN